MHYEIVRPGRLLFVATIVGPLVCGALLGPGLFGTHIVPGTSEAMAELVLGTTAIGALFALIFFGWVPALVASLLCILVARSSYITLPRALLASVAVTVFFVVAFGLLSGAPFEVGAIIGVAFPIAGAAAATVSWILADILKLIRPLDAP